MAPPRPARGPLPRPVLLRRGHPSGHRTPTPFLRLRWTGSPDEWAIGIYKATTETYSENEFPWSYGPLTGTPEQGIDDTLALYAGPPPGQ